MNEPIFEIIDGDKCYKVYLNGQVEGFGENASIINRMAYVAEWVIAALRVAQSSNRQLPGLDGYFKAMFGDRFGLSHGKPEY